MPAQMLLGKPKTKAFCFRLTSFIIWFLRVHTMPRCLILWNLIGQRLHPSYHYFHSTKWWGFSLTTLRDGECMMRFNTFLVGDQRFCRNIHRVNWILKLCCCFDSSWKCGWGMEMWLSPRMNDIPYAEHCVPYVLPEQKSFQNFPAK